MQPRFADVSGEMSGTNLLLCEIDEFPDVPICFIQRHWHTQRTGAHFMQDCGVLHGVLSHTHGMILFFGNCEARS